MTIELDKKSLYRLLLMVSMGLISPKQTVPWAGRKTAELDNPPRWLCELATLKSTDEIERCISEYVASPPAESFDADFSDDYGTACLWVRYGRRDLSWASFLQKAGEHTDSWQAGVEPCEFYYELLNELEAKRLSKVTEARQVLEVRPVLNHVIPKVLNDFASMGAESGTTPPLA